MHRRTLVLLALLVAIAFPAAAHNRTPLGDLSSPTSPAIAWNEPLGEITVDELPVVDAATIAAFDDIARMDVDLPADPLANLNADVEAILRADANAPLAIVSGLENRCSGFAVSLVGPNVRQTNELSLKLHWGHDHVRNRWFDPNTGTWLTPDPLGYQDSSNLYAFAGGDPVNGRDPLGLCSAPDPRACFGRLRAALSSAVDDASAAVGGVGDWLREKAVGTAIAASSPMAVPVVTTAQFIKTSVTEGPKAAVKEWATTLPVVHTIVSGSEASDAAAAGDLRAETYYRLETGYSAVGDVFLGYGIARGLSGLMTRGPVSNLIPAEVPRVGETTHTRTGRAVHTEQEALRRESGMFDVVNQHIVDAEGRPISVPRRVNLKTGVAVLDKGEQFVRPDAVIYERELILDDKTLTRNVLVKDRQEMIRYIRAFEVRTGKLPKTIAIQRYDPATGQPIRTDLFTPQDFLPRTGTN